MVMLRCCSGAYGDVAEGVYDDGEAKDGKEHGESVDCGGNRDYDDEEQGGDARDIDAE